MRKRGGNRETVIQCVTVDGNTITHRFPGSLVPLRAIHIPIAFLLDGPFWPHLSQTLGIIHYGGYSTRDNLLAFDLSRLLAPLAAMFRAQGPRTFHPHGRTGFLAAALRVGRFQLRIAQALIHRLIVAPSHAGHPS